MLATRLGAAGPRPALLVNASFVAIAAAASPCRSAARPARRRHASGDGHSTAVSPLRRDRVLRLTIAAAVGALLFVSASLTVEIFCLKDVVGASDTAYALLVCASMAAMVWEPPLCPAQLAAAAALALEGLGMSVQTA